MHRASFIIFPYIPFQTHTFKHFSVSNHLFYVFYVFYPSRIYLFPFLSHCLSHITYLPTPIPQGKEEDEERDTASHDAESFNADGKDGKEGEPSRKKRPIPEEELAARAKVRAKLKGKLQRVNEAVAVAITELTQVRPY